MHPGWLYLLLGSLLLWRIAIPGGKRSSHQNTDRLSIIIPARNEEKNLHALLSSLKAEAASIHEVIVVDDHSEDETGNIARNYGMRVIVPPPLPSGWFGKSWACWNGAKEADGDVFMFLDADTTIEPGGVENILSSRQNSGGALTIQPYHKITRVYENLSGMFNLIAVMGIGSFHILSRVIPPAGAFGQCFVCTKKDYEKVGGHSAISHEILEHMMLGKTFLNHGIPLRNYIGRQAVSMRMYPGGVKELTQGWSKSFASGAGATNLLLLIPIILWVSGSLSAGFSLLGLEGASGYETAGILTLYGLYSIQFYILLRAVGSFIWSASLCFPLLSLFFITVFAYSAIRTFFMKNVAWKGRSISLTKKKGR
ncbi:glycosyltransferase [Bacillus salacetis]|uniref:4,4'-diaponeurosporenoate glycosyltransferase n=1 Tax=Bacillus salacetis TaxID=2315464 RepID=A0A3A1RAM3_9BACI|nr:glycosyltransferase [Bacillus salacetis]RIW38964.1 glycosyltransferase [Bacillus salacetis]